MTAPHIVDPAGLLGEALAEASPDLMRSFLQSIINTLVSADADAVVGAARRTGAHRKIHPRSAQGRGASRVAGWCPDLGTARVAGTAVDRDRHRCSWGRTCCWHHALSDP